MSETYFLIGGIILFFIIANVLSYFYLKYKREQFFDYIKNRKYILIPKVEIEIEGYSQLGAKISYRKADIVFLDDNIFILSFNRSIIQLTKNQEIFPNVFDKFMYDSKLKVNDRLQIKTLNGSLQVNLNLKNKDFNFEQYLNEPK